MGPSEVKEVWVTRARWRAENGKKKSGGMAGRTGQQGCGESAEEKQMNKKARGTNEGGDAGGGVRD